MPEQAANWDETKTTLSAQTYNSGKFVFTVGCDLEALSPMLNRVNDAQSRFNSLPSLPNIIDQLEKKVLVSSVYSTNTIEGGTFTEEETAQVLELNPAEVQKIEEKRLINLKAAIKYVKQHQSKAFSPTTGKPFDIAVIYDIHKLVGEGLGYAAGELREKAQGRNTVVGDKSHGGIYTPPKSREDISFLLRCYKEWLNSENIIKLPAVVRASLAHYYFERIHPFRDGNGRTGRLIEMLILEQSGYASSSSAVWAYYQQNIHEYFTLFNSCRKSKATDCNQAFVGFTIKGLFSAVNHLHDQANKIISLLIFNSALSQARDNKKITPRQYRLVKVIMESERGKTRGEIFKLTEVAELFANLTYKTFSRDIDKLEERGFIFENDERFYIPW